MLPNAASDTFPAALKAEREQRQLSRAALARLAGIHPVMVGRYETGRVRPTAGSWLALNRAFGFQPDADEGAPAGEQRLTLDEIVATLRARGVTAITLSFA